MNKNLSKLFLNTVYKDSQKVILSYKNQNKWNKPWENVNREQLYSMIDSCSYILKQKGISKGDRIAYKGKNSIEWIAWNMACHSVGGVWVPMYSDQNLDYCKHIVNDCSPKLFISDKDINIGNVDYLSNKIESSDNYSVMNIETNELATLIYTSGTTGNPKGVMLTHENLISNLEDIHSRFKDVRNTSSLNILPWAHI